MALFFRQFWKMLVYEKTSAPLQPYHFIFFFLFKNIRRPPDWSMEIKFFLPATAF
jgi:hypothetical protein